jgi:hypothetical protein
VFKKPKPLRPSGQARRQKWELAPELSPDDNPSQGEGTRRTAGQIRTRTVPLPDVSANHKQRGYIQQRDNPDDF